MISYYWNTFGTWSGLAIKVNWQKQRNKSLMDLSANPTSKLKMIFTAKHQIHQAKEKTCEMCFNGFEQSFRVSVR